MLSKKIKKKSISDDDDDEEDSDLIVNIDDFCTEIDLKIDNNDNLDQKNNENSNKEILFRNSEIISSSYSNNLINLKNPKESKEQRVKDQNYNTLTNIYNNTEVKISKLNNDNFINEDNEDKTIFSKIAEDLYVDCLNSLRPRKNLYLYKEKEDNYNKLTIEKYLFTCADKENSNNDKIINDFLERKNKENLCKKIGIELSKNGKIDNFRKLSSEHKKRKSPKPSRSPEQFLDDQRIMNIKHKNLIEKLIKLNDDRINLSIKDRPTITKNSEKLANLNKDHNKDVHIKLYEEYNLKKKNQEERKSNTLNLNEIYLIGNKKLNKEAIFENSERLYKEYEKKKNLLNEIEIKQLKDIKNLSGTSLIGKNSNDIITKKLIKIYKETFKSVFNKDISDNFEINFNDYLLFLYEFGLIKNNYLIKEKKDKKNYLLNNNAINKYTNNECFNIRLNYKIIDLGIDEDFLKNENKNSAQNTTKRNTHFISKSVGKKFNENESEFNIIKESWNTMTKSKIFNQQNLVSSKMFLLFYLSLCGIYKGNINNYLIKKEFPFLLEDKVNLIDTNLSKHIYKNFYYFRNSIINNILSKNKKESEIKDNKYKSLKFSSKSFIKTKYFPKNKTYDINNMNNDNNKIINLNFRNKLGFNQFQKSTKSEKK